MHTSHMFILALGMMGVQPSLANDKCDVGSGDRVGYTLAGDSSSLNVTGLGAISCAPGFVVIPAATYYTAAGVPKAACNATHSPNFTFSGCGCPAGEYRADDSCRLLR